MCLRKPKGRTHGPQRRGALTSWARAHKPLWLLSSCPAARTQVEIARKAHLTPRLRSATRGINVTFRIPLQLLLPLPIHASQQECRWQGSPGNLSDSLARHTEPPKGASVCLSARPLPYPINALPAFPLLLSPRVTPSVSHHLTLAYSPSRNVNSGRTKIATCFVFWGNSSDWNQPTRGAP